MTDIVWTGAGGSDWQISGNWSPPQVPRKRDDVSIPAGAPNNPSISGLKVNGVSIALGNTEGGAVTLAARSATFTDSTLALSDGDPSGSVLQATLACSGTTSFGGSITVNGPGGTLTIDAGGGAFTLTDALDKTTVFVSQESALGFTNGSVTTAGVIEIEGYAYVAAGTTIGGSGLVLLEAGGSLSMEGSVGSGQLIVLADALTAVSIANPAQFQGTLGLAPVSGTLIAFPSLAAQSLTVANNLLSLFSGPDGTGDIVAKINVVSVDAEDFAPDTSQLTTADFSLSGDPGGAVVTYAPGGLVLQQSIPAPIVAAAGSTVSLESIFQQAFGIEAPPFLSVTLIHRKYESGTSKDQLYWAIPAAAPAWLLANNPIAQNETVAPAQWSEVSLLVGNNIDSFPQFQAQIAEAPGQQADYVLYTVWTIPPDVFNQVGGTPGAPTPQDVVNAANAFLNVFGNVPNTNLCNWIADNVAAAAGAPMPLPDAQLDPADNVSGGFWRIAYTGQAPDPVHDWSSLVQPGDIVRMRWMKTNLPAAGGHSTTVVAGVENGEITVYDNACHLTPSSGSCIGQHQAAYWNGTDPASITIYRLDPSNQYLIVGGSGGGVIQGSCYNNLICPGGGATVITAGAGNNQIQGSIANLNTITVTDFHAGDLFDFTDLDPASATAKFTTPWLSIYAGVQQVALINLPNLAQAPTFSVESDNSGGTLVALAS